MLKLIFRNRMMMSVMALLLVLLFFISGPVSYAANGESSDESVKAKDEEEISYIRVGWFNQEGMQEGSNSYSLNGYNYEYLQKISEYSDWKYEFIYEDYNTCLEMLKNGQIDLMGYINKTDENEEEYLFSELPEGYDSFFIAAASNSDLNSGDFKQMNGGTIALVRTDFNFALVKDLEKHHHIQLRTVFYDNMDQCFEALESGAADMALGRDTLVESGYKTIYEFPQYPFYFAISRQSASLKEELDSALQQIKLSIPDYSENLHDKYFNSPLFNNGIALTDSEKRFIENNPVIKVAVVSNSYPLSFIGEDGEYHGFIYDYLDLIAEKSGLSFEFLQYRTYAAMLNAIGKGDADITLQVPDEIDFASENQLNLTQSFLTLQRGFLSLEGHSIETIATEAGSYQDPFLTETNDYGYELFSSSEACLNGVILGSVDAMLINSYAYNKVNELYSSYDFSFQILMSMDYYYCMGISESLDYRLVSILDKSISSVNSNKVNSIITRVTTVKIDLTVGEWMFENRYVVAVALLLFLLTGLVVIFGFQHRITKYQVRSNIELEKKNTELEKANAAKSDFLSRTSHDLRTPMNAIMGLTALALDEESKIEKDFYLSQIATSSEFLLGLINDVLDMEKIENDAVEFKPEPYSLDAFSQMIRTMILPLCQQKKIDFVFDDFDFKQAIVVDHTRFNQIFFNLISNSVKYTRPGGTVTFNMTHKLIHGGIAELDFIVADTGIGMSEEFLQHMYEPFSQENRRDGTKGQGTGLGLAIVKKMVDMMGGRIEVESHLNEGTIFLVHLEVPISDTKIESVMTIDPTKMDKVLKDRRILLVDDQPLNLQVAKKILEKKELVVDTASDGEEAVRVFGESEDNYYDAVLMDIRMPVMNGLEAARAIRALDRRDALNVPIIAMTANTFDEDKKHSMDAGMNAHLGKPIIPKELLECLYRFFYKGE